MKKTFFILCIVIVMACVSEDYFNHLNSLPLISTTADLAGIDTLKIGKLLNPNCDVYFTLPLTITDYNANLKSLIIDIPQNIVLQDNTGALVPTVYDLDDKYNSSNVFKIFRIVPVQPGSYTITATAADKFNTSAAVEKCLYVFDNLPPKCVVADAYYIAPPETLYTIYADIRASFDQDKKWGGSIVSYHTLYHYSWQEESKLMDNLQAGVFVTTDDTWWETVGWVEAWVKDNEGAESEHIRIDLPRRDIIGF